YQDERVLIVANLSRFVQYVQLDLNEFAGVFPEEMLGRTPFPQVTDQPYLLTLGPHSFLWFSLPAPESRIVALPAQGDQMARVTAELPLLRGKRPLSKRFQPAHWDEIESLLPQYLTRNKLVTSQADVSSAELVHVAPIQVRDIEVWFLLVRVETSERL